MEKEKIFEDIVKTLLIRTSDTNKFIRNLIFNFFIHLLIYTYISYISYISPEYNLKNTPRIDASDCLDTMVENVTGISVRLLAVT